MQNQQDDSIPVSAQRRGLFIVVEGMDASGKTRAHKSLLKALTDLGLEVYPTREIGGTPFGEEIRKLIFNTEKPVDPLARMLACLASRQQHVQEVIQPLITKGVSVLSDRFFDSTFVYQGLIDNQLGAYYELAALECLKSLFRRPDITVLLKVSPEVALQRTFNRGAVDNDQYKKDHHLLWKAAEGYERVHRQMSVLQRKNTFVVDADEDIEQVDEQLSVIAREIVRGYNQKD